MRAFSLVELSIVLVILGLLTGGILAGQSLIRASELRSFATEYQRWITSTHTFRDKYSGIPGDIQNATRFWQLQMSGSGCTSNSGVTTISGTGRCDGNGNGTLANSSAGYTSGETFQYWRQLALAGLIEGTYSGIADSDPDTSIIGSNVPGSKLNNGGWSIQYAYIGANAAYVTGPNYTSMTHLHFGAQRASEITTSPLLKPEEAWNIDVKLDDGKPSQGSLFGLWWATCTTATVGTDTAADYRLTSSTNACALMFVNPF